MGKELFKYLCPTNVNVEKAAEALKRLQRPDRTYMCVLVQALVPLVAVTISVFCIQRRKPVVATFQYQFNVFRAACSPREGLHPVGPRLGTAARASTARALLVEQEPARAGDVPLAGRDVLGARLWGRTPTSTALCF